MYWWLLGKEKMLKDDTAAIILDGVEIVQKVNNGVLKTRPSSKTNIFQQNNSESSNATCDRMQVFLRTNIYFIFIWVAYSWSSFSTCKTAKVAIADGHDYYSTWFPLTVIFLISEDKRVIKLTSRKSDINYIPTENT
jgi:hypothetical protein